MTEKPTLSPEEVAADADRSFLLKSWLVSVDGYGSGTYFCVSRGKALAEAWRSDAFSGGTFAEFLKRARCREGGTTSAWFGDEINVLGRPAFFVESNRAYVRAVYAGEAAIVNVHPYDVLPERYRPAGYQGSHLLGDQKK